MDTKLNILKRHQNTKIKERAKSRLNDLYVVAVVSIIFYVPKSVSLFD